MKPPKEPDPSLEFLRPVRKTLEVKGKLTYNEGDRAFTNLKIKREFLHEFPHLKDKEEDFEFVYLMKLHRSFDALKKEIEQMEKKADGMPIVLFLGKERKEEV